MPKRGKIMQTNKRLVFLLEAAILAAIAFLLDLATSFIGKMPQGGSISLAMVPVLIMGFRHGLKGGLLTGFLLGLLQTVMGYTTIVHPVQGFLDYFAAFTVVGAGGIFYKQIQNSLNPVNKGRLILYVTLAAFLGSFLRFAAHTLAGAVFFAEFAGDQPVLLYSAGYNASYMIPTFIICTIILVLMLLTSKALIINRK
jgi:thiamine transporter